jgi:thymidylate synthase|tara:strand:+ start:59 stop:934 length:876 start_codon:yes stop_codon:yes gene_type:complete
MRKLLYGRNALNTADIIMIKINIENEYKGLLSEILNTGSDKEDRTGTGTKSLFGRTIKHDMSLGFPILTGKRVSFNAARTELLWILQGRTDLKYLEDNGVKYWRPDYERSGRTDETLGPVYGKQWRDFNGVDQLVNLVNAIRINPHSRRMLVSAWNPADMDDMVLPPCHYGFQIYINNGVMDLMWQQRSVDVFLGLPYDISMYGLLLEMLAKGSNLIPGQLIGQLGDCHLYNNHLEQAREYRRRPKRALPQLELESGIYLDEFLYIPLPDKIKLINYNPYAAIKAELSVGK